MEEAGCRMTVQGLDSVPGGTDWVKAGQLSGGNLHDTFDTFLLNDI